MGRDKRMMGDKRLLRFPFEGRYRVTSDFAAHVARGSRAPGIDYALPSGTRVLAADDGRVSACRWGDAGGRYVMVNHGEGVLTLYSHLRAVSRVEGERVVAGEEIGLSGNTGRSTGPHLHFAVKKAGEWVDPEPFLTTE